MQGVIFNLAEEVIVASYGEDTWDTLLDKAGLDGSYTSLGNYPNGDLFRLVSAVLAPRVPADDVMRALGEGPCPSWPAGA
jgi:hypothetical protein